MKYRIKQIGDTFYPQQKKLLFWKNIKIITCYKHSYDDELTIDNWNATLREPSLKKAIQTLNSYINNYLKPFKCCGHNIITALDIYTATYYYIDEVNRYSDSSEEICLMVAEVERSKKESKRVTIHKLEKNEELSNYVSR